MSFIHNPKFFSKEEIIKRARKYEFPNPLAVEIFLWDCELAAQFQRFCKDIVLRGGAAAQLHLPLEKQRGSIDIDVIAPLDNEEIKKIIEKMSKSLETVTFKLHEPKKPIPKLPMITYFAKTSSALELRRKELEIKIDILLEHISLPTVLLKNVQTFAMNVKAMKCLTVGALIGDKILTLAKGSIGMELEADYPKQIYDIDALLELTKTEKDASEIIDSVEKLTELEASYRNIRTSPSQVMEDVIETMNKYSLVDTSGGESSIKKNIESFQQFFVNKAQRSPLYEWSSKALKIKFLASLLKENFENKLSMKDLLNIITKCGAISTRLKTISGTAVIDMREKLLALAETKIPYFKEMKGKPLHRVFWQMVTPTNFQNVESLLL